jgi:hypothetical protein
MKTIAGLPGLLTFIVLLNAGAPSVATAGLYTDSSFPNRSYFPLTPDGLTPRVGDTGAADSSSALVVDIGSNISLSNPANRYGITAIGIREHSDRPCEVTLFGRLLDQAAGGTDGILAKAKLDRCGLGAGTLDYKSAAFSNSQNRFLHSIKVCNTRTIKVNERLKGIEMFPASVSAAAVVTPVTTGSAKFERTRCKNWSETVSCGNGRVAVGVVMHHRADSFFGISLKCADVKTDTQP